MEDGKISDRQMNASSEWSATHSPSHARLNYQPTSPSMAGSWSVRTSDIHQWLQVDLESRFTKVTRIATQGRWDYDQWVTKYKLQYSKNGVNFLYFREQGQTKDKVK